MLVLAKEAHSYEDGVNKIKDAISSGSALDKLREFIENQGGNKDIVDNYDLLPKASNIIEIKSGKYGYVTKIEAEEVGISAMMLGAGRETKEDELDLAAGIVLNKKVGDYVDEQDTIAYMHVNEMKKFEEAKKKGLGVVSLGSKMIDPPVVKRAQRTIDLALLNNMIKKDWRKQWN